MSEHSLHDFLDYMVAVREAMSQEYRLIQKRVIEDPGTAGDRAEENWADFLRNWLPSNYQIVTKGRVIGHNNVSSPQIDILILQPSYPKALKERKIYFAGGVVAAFECKLTLRSEHIRKAAENALIVKNLAPVKRGNPFDELYQPIFFGLLAHSCKLGKGPIDKAMNCLLGYYYEDPIFKLPKYNHPRYLLDIVCVSDTALFAENKSISLAPFPFLEEDYVKGSVIAGYDIHAPLREDCDIYTSLEKNRDYGLILGLFIAKVNHFLAVNDLSLRSFTEYLYMSIDHHPLVSVIPWKLQDVLSDEVIQELRTREKSDNPWSKWNLRF